MPQPWRDRLRPITLQILNLAYGHDLSRLAELHGSDKWGVHWYTQHYQRFFSRLRWRRLKILEIGVGGYHHSSMGGNSLRMWKNYFPRSTIFGLDIEDKRHFEEARIRIFVADQSCVESLVDIASAGGPFDIIIDDGSHRNDHVVKTFQTLFPFLSSEGIYAVEDTQTSYWPEFGGTSEELEGCQTMMCFFKRLADGLNYSEIIRPGYVPTYLDLNIVGLHFFHNLVIIEKGSNREKSNYLIDNCLPLSDLPDLAP